MLDCGDGMIKKCEICGVSPATVPDRERIGRPVKRLCSPCHTLKLVGDMLSWSYAEKNITGRGKMSNRDIPERTKETIDAYVESGRPTGGFLRAVLSNDLAEAMARGDEDNLTVLFEIVTYLYNYVPVSCWGTPEKVDKWIKQGGRVGMKSLFMEGRE